VQARQRKARRAVIERRRVPTDRRVARRTIGRRERCTRRGMRRSIGCLPSRQMASRGSTSGRRNRQRIIVVDVAERASHGGMAIR